MAPRRQGSVCPQPRISFFGSRAFGFGSGPSRLKYRLLRYFYTRKPCAKEVPETDYLMQRKQYLKRTTLRRLKIPLRTIRSEEGPHYRLGAKREQESCHMTSDNQPLFTSWRSSADFLLGLYCVAWLMQESVSSRIFVRRNEKPTRSVPETWGRMYNVLTLRN